METLPPRQKQLFLLLQKNGFVSYRIVMAKMKLKSPNAVTKHLEALIKKGYVKRKVEACPVCKIKKVRYEPVPQNN